MMKRLFPDATTMLYGSQARGTATAQSDVDILIILPDKYQGNDFVKRRSEIVDSLYDIEIDDGVRISPLVMIKSIWEKRNTPFSHNVNRESIVI